MSVVFQLSALREKHYRAGIYMLGLWGGLLIILTNSLVFLGITSINQNNSAQHQEHQMFVSEMSIQSRKEALLGQDIAPMLDKRWYERRRSELHHLSFILSTTDNIQNILLIFPRESDLYFIDNMYSLYSVTVLEGNNVMESIENMTKKISADVVECYDIILVMEDIDILMKESSLVPHQLPPFAELLNALSCPSGSLQVSTSFPSTALHWSSFFESQDGHVIVLSDESKCGMKHNTQCGFIVINQSDKLESRSRWFGDEAVMTLLLRYYQEISSDLFAFHYLDGPTIKSLEQAPKLLETVYCYWNNGEDCELLNNKIFTGGLYKMDSFEVKPSKAGEWVGRGLFAVEDIKPDSLLFYDDTEFVFLSAFSSDILENMLYGTLKDLPLVKSLWNMVNYIWGYGYANSDFGLAMAVDSGIKTFTNHGCNGTMNTGDFETWHNENWRNLTEYNADPDYNPFDSLGYNSDNAAIDNFYSPVAVRQMYSHGFDIPLRLIQKGEEILSNYLVYYHNPDWKEGVNNLRSMCTGALGVVAKVDKNVGGEHGEHIF